MEQGKILAITDSPGYVSTRDLGTLYPGKVDELDLGAGPVTAAALAPYSRVWTLIRKAENAPRLDYTIVREHARKTGARVVSHLLEYARGSGLAFRFRNAGSARHKLRIVAASDPITNGFAVGDTVYWYRNSSDIDEPPVGHYAWREIDCGDDPRAGRRVLARSPVTGGAMWIEERFPSGGVILAYDLASPVDLALMEGDPWILHRGSFAKYLPAGNLFGATVRYGRYLDRRLALDELLDRVRGLAGLRGAAVRVEVRDEGRATDDSPVLSVRFGNPDGPCFLLMSVKHGVEWENAYGMLVTLEHLARGGIIDLERFRVVAVPVMNPFGYANGVRHNANGVDLNRQLRPDWETFRGWSDDVVEPWTFDFKGFARGAEPEAAIEARLRAEPNLVCAIDAHAMAGAPVLFGAGPRAEVLHELTAQLLEDLRDRYLVRYLPDRAPRQLTLELYPGQPGDDEPGGLFHRRVTSAPVFDLTYENVGQLPDVHATVMQTDFAAGLNLTAIRHIAQYLSRKGKR
jgi:hypothetical protein